MAAIKKIATNTQFEVPSLAAAHPGYAAAQQRLAKVETDGANALRELRKFEADLRANPATRPMRAAVAEAVGDVIEADPRPARAAELRAMVGTAEAAKEILVRRLNELRTPASRAVLEQVRAEYAARVAEFVRALNSVRAASADLDAIINPLEAHDVSWHSLGIFRIPGLRERIDGIVKEAKEHGYV
jgi:hypothetical protein